MGQPIGKPYVPKGIISMQLVPKKRKKKKRKCKNRKKKEKENVEYMPRLSYDIIILSIMHGEICSAGHSLLCPHHHHHLHLHLHLHLHHQTWGILFKDSYWDSYGILIGFLLDSCGILMGFLW